MIISMLLGVGMLLISAIFSLLGILPDMPGQLISLIDFLFELLEQGINLFGLFVDMSTVKILIPIVIAIITFDKIYHLILYVLKKVPFIDIE